MFVGLVAGAGMVLVSQNFEEQLPQKSRTGVLSAYDCLRE
jgi:hypothetical protein